VPHQGGLEVGDVAVDRRAVVGDRAGADPHERVGVALLGRLGVAPLALAVGGFIQRVERGVGAREMLAVAARRQDAPLDLDRAQFETADAFVEVGDPGRLAHLAVVDDVDGGLDLVLDHVGDRARQARAVLVAVGGDAARQRLERLEVGRADQAARVAGQYPVHGLSS
jgi:hypothetical protein